MLLTAPLLTSLLAVPIGEPIERTTTTTTITTTVSYNDRTEPRKVIGAKPWLVD
ncbi:hypothetical protein RP20_CCG012072 [Aedes albopictus]|nr:hypothetical protein RP20_CCG012072 [Aedes albopictus]